MVQIGIVTGRDAKKNVLVKPAGRRTVVTLEDSLLVAGAYGPYAGPGLHNLKN